HQHQHQHQHQQQQQQIRATSPANKLKAAGGAKTTHLRRIVALPGARSQESGVRSQEPGARSQEPGARSQEPGAEQPRAQKPGSHPAPAHLAHLFNTVSPMLNTGH
ncbi:hypothetical protein E4U43_001077, partial [Claviceps pusilla]